MFVAIAITLAVILCFVSINEAFKYLLFSVYYQSHIAFSFLLRLLFYAICIGAKHCILVYYTNTIENFKQIVTTYEKLHRFKCTKIKQWRVVEYIGLNKDKTETITFIINFYINIYHTFFLRLM